MSTSLLPIMTPAILHLDMDAFFVNVHLLEHPEDKGLPVVVGGSPNKRGVVASASYEARQFGIRSAMPSSQAIRLCPQVKFVGWNWPLIRQCSRQVMDILAGYGPLEQVSVDEAYVDLTDYLAENPAFTPEQLAAHIRQTVKAKTNLPASVGLATSKLVAKVASDHDKPEGCTIVPSGTEAAFLAPLPTRAIWGIGPRTAERLAELGIETCGQLATAVASQLQAKFGKQAENLQRRAQGIDHRPVETERGTAKSISQEWTFNNDINDPAILRDKLQQMSESVAKSLQKRNLVAHTVFVKFRWADFTTFTRQKTVEVGIDSAETIYRLGEAIWAENWPEGQRMRLLGIGVSKLMVLEARQLKFNLDTSA